MTSHVCPAPRCTKRVGTERLTCPSHWYAIPKPLRSAIWRAWDGGAGAGTPEHQAAITAAIRSLEAGESR